MTQPRVVSLSTCHSESRCKRAIVPRVAGPPRQSITMYSEYLLREKRPSVWLRDQLDTEPLARADPWTDFHTDASYPWKYSALITKASALHFLNVPTFSKRNYNASIKIHFPSL